MTEKKTCPTCGAPLPSDATGGACPKCLLQAGFATGGSSPRAGDHVPTPEELAPKFPGLVIEDLLGRGGMGVVYRARHKALDREVALKVLPSAVASDSSRQSGAFADRFQREARALAKLQHPNIVAVHDFGQTDGLFWLVMEYVDGANIRQAMRAGQIGPKEALAIVPQICDALQYAHEHGVVHRDIKPENVLLDKSGRVKVADFGLAKLMERDAADLTLTGAGQVMGTPHYMAPEQWEKPTTVDHRADIYSLGVVFYEMLTGELPVGRFAAPSKKSDVDSRIDEIVLRTLEREREARYQQVSEVKTDMGRASVGAAPPVPAAAHPPMPAMHSRHWKWPIGVTTIAGVLALLWGLFSTEATATRFWVGGFGLIVCLVQFVDWRIRLRHPDDGDTNKRMAWLVGCAVVSVGMCLVLANTLHTEVMRNAAGTLGFVTGAFLLVEMWKLRRTPRPPATEARKPISVVGWVAIIFLSFVFLGGLAVCALSFSGNIVDRQAVLEDRVQRDQAAQRALVYPETADDFSEIGNKWKRLQALGAEPKIEQLIALYDTKDRTRVMFMSAAERADEARRGALGLPLLPVDRVRPLSAFRFEGVEFDKSATPPLRATASIVAGATRIKYPMSRSLEGDAHHGRLSPWDFAAGQVEIETGAAPVAPATRPSYVPAPSDAAFPTEFALRCSAAGLEPDVRAVKALWAKCAAVAASRDVDAAIALYEPKERDALRAMARDPAQRLLFAEGCRTGALGMPLTATAMGPEEFAQIVFMSGQAYLVPPTGAEPEVRAALDTPRAPNSKSYRRIELFGVVHQDAAGQWIEWSFQRKWCGWQ